MQTEHALHVQVARLLDAIVRPPAFWSSVDAGAGKMTPAAAGRRKARGVKPGLPDVLVWAPGLCLGIELKTAKGRLSAAQEDMANAFWDAGHRHVVCRSLDEVETALSKYGIPTRRVTWARAA